METKSRTDEKTHFSTKDETPIWNGKNLTEIVEEILVEENDPELKGKETEQDIKQSEKAISEKLVSEYGDYLGKVILFAEKTGIYNTRKLLKREAKKKEKDYLVARSRVQSLKRKHLSEFDKQLADSSRKEMQYTACNNLQEKIKSIRLEMDSLDEELKDMSKSGVERGDKKYLKVRENLDALTRSMYNTDREYQEIKFRTIKLGNNLNASKKRWAKRDSRLRRAEMGLLYSEMVIADLKALAEDSYVSGSELDQVRGIVSSCRKSQDKIGFIYAEEDKIDSALSSGSNDMESLANEYASGGEEFIERNNLQRDKLDLVLDQMMRADGYK